MSSPDTSDRPGRVGRGIGPFDRLFRDFSSRWEPGCPGEAGPGLELGSYRLERLIGRGGMGSVWLARRADGQFQQDVAIKLLRHDLVGREPNRHFLIERQILARLKHPTIAGLIDGGVTEGGCPYLVMEYVDGTPIDQYCDRHRLSIRRRLLLFMAVCEAVHYAHQNLVVHRDLKPGNILVTAEGHPKLLDFGVAKLVGPGDDDPETALWHPMTPEYASPEQVAGEPITTASDVYALGALLYELLVGQRPHDFTGCSPPAILRTLLEVDPPPPSERLASLGRAGANGGADPNEIARARELRPRSLAGDLDAIVMKALARDPAERYRSVAVLADEIRSYLGGYAVQARPGTPAYRASRLVRRHPAAAALLVTLAVAAGALMLTMQTQANRVARERDRAEQVTQLLGDALASADPTVAPGGDPTVRQVVEEAVARWDSGDALDPEVAGRLLLVLAAVTSNLDNPGRAVELQSDGVARLRGRVPADDPLFLQSLDQLGYYLSEAGRGDEARRVLAEALAIARGLGPQRVVELAQTLNAYGLALQMDGRYDEASPYYEEALSIYEGATAPPDSLVETTLANLGWIAHSRADWPTAETRFREVLESRRDRLGESHPQTALAMLNLSDVLRRQGNFASAAPLASSALAAMRSAYQEPHSLIANALGANARILSEDGQLAEAIALQRESVSMYRATRGDESPPVLYALNALAGILERAGQLDEAALRYRESADGFAAAVGPSHPFTAVILANLARTEGRRGREAEAEALYRRAVPALDSAWAGTPEIARTLSEFGDVLRARGKCAEAEPLLRRAIALESARWPPAHVRVLEPERRLGGCLVDLGRFEEAESLLLAVRGRIGTDGEAAALTDDVGRDLIHLYEAWGRPAEARAARRRLDSPPD